MNEFHGDGIEALAAAGAAITSWRFGRFGKARADTLVLRGAAVFFLVLAAILLAAPAPPWLAVAGAAMGGIALVVVSIGGIPGLQTQVPDAARSRVLWELCAVWGPILVVALFGQR